MNLTPKLRAKIIELFKDGYSVAELANTYYKRVSDIERVLREAMIEQDRKEPK